MDECQFDPTSDYPGCCCQCKWHIADQSHPETDGGHLTHQRGWICIGPAMTEAEPWGCSGWSEHGLCEMFTQRQGPKFEMMDRSAEISAIQKQIQAKYTESAE